MNLRQSPGSQAGSLPARFVACVTPIGQETPRMVLSQVDSNWFKFAVGALTILAVVGNSWLRKRGRAMKVEV